MNIWQANQIPKITNEVKQEAVNGTWYNWQRTMIVKKSDGNLVAYRANMCQRMLASFLCCFGQQYYSPEDKKAALLSSSIYDRTTLHEPLTEKWINEAIEGNKVIKVALLPVCATSPDELDSKEIISRLVKAKAPTFIVDFEVAPGPEYLKELTTEQVEEFATLACDNRAFAQK